MAHGKRRSRFENSLAKLPRQADVHMAQGNWNPNQMTPEQSAEMQAAANKVISAWLLLRAAMVEALHVQRRCQGGSWPVVIRGAAVRVALEVLLFVHWLVVKPEPVVPLFPANLDAEEN